MTEDDLEKLKTEARRLQYQEFQELKRTAYQLQGEYGRWLVASLLLIHGAGILFLAQVDDAGLMATLIKTTFWWNVGGLLLALLCGFTTWANWSYHALKYHDVTPGMIVGTEHWPMFDPAISRRINITYRLSIVFGIASSACILAAAIAIYLAMS